MTIEATDARSIPLFPFPADSPGGAQAEYVRRRAACPFGTVHTPAGHDAVLLVRGEDVEAALADTRLAHNLTAPGSPRIHLASSFRQDPRLMTNMDGAQHLRLRRIVAPSFTPRNVSRWEPAINAIAEELCDAMIEAGPPADITTAYCFALPVRIICELLGVPRTDADRFRQWSGAFLSVVPMTPAERAEQVEEFTAYVTGLVAARRRDPGDALIDSLIAARDGDDRLTEPELVMMVLGLIAVGNEATSNSLARALRTLLRGQRELWTSLIADPGRLPAAVEELLRHSPPGGMFAMRQARETVDFPSGTLHAGQGVIIASESALRDPDVYPDPDSVRFDRPRRPQLVFGGGPHYCLGAHLAKAELASGIGCLLRRMPGLHLEIAYEAVRFSNGDILSSPLALPVSW